MRFNELLMHVIANEILEQKVFLKMGFKKTIMLILISWTILGMGTALA